MEPKLGNKDILCSLPVPDLLHGQLSLINDTSLYMRRSNFSLNPIEAQNTLMANSGRSMLVFDIGGSAIKYNIVRVSESGLVVVDDSREMHTDKQGQGENYLDFIQRVIVMPETINLPVAVSTAGEISNGELVDSPNFPGFIARLKQAGGFKSVFGNSIPVMNDAEAGAVAAAVGVLQLRKTLKQIIYIINGGGIGGAVWSAGSVISMEPGHIIVIPELNPNGVTTACDFKKRTHTCLERVGASKAGIEAQWEMLYGEKLSGVQIAELLYGGDKRALKLYDYSTRIVAHIIAGIQNSMILPIENMAVVMHGGAFKTEGYVQRIRSILAKHYDYENVDMILTSKLGMSNACMSGLAIAALVNGN